MTDTTPPAVDDSPRIAEESESRIWYSKQNVELLKELAACVEIADRVNPESWALQGNRNGSVALNLWGMIAIWLGADTAQVILPGSRDESKWRSLGTNINKVKYPDDAIFRLGKIPVQECLSLFSEHRDSIHEATRFLAGRSDTGTFSRNSEHRPDLVDALSQLSNKVLPQPAYFEPEAVNRDIAESQHWLIRQPSHPVIDWRNQHRQPFIRFVWPSPKVDLSTLPTSLDELVQALEHYGINKAAARRLHNFAHGIKTQDIVAIADGPYANTFAAGTIEGPYEYAEEDLMYPHRRAMEPMANFNPIWLGHQEPEIAHLRFGWGPIALSPEEFEAMVTPEESTKNEENIVASEETESATSFGAKSVTDTFASSGLVYTTNQIATFYTALQTRGFVVLSGISGTGKSKIAQGFVDLLPDPSPESSPVTIDRESLIELSVKPYTRKYKRVVIPVDQLGTLPPMNPGDQIVVRSDHGRCYRHWPACQPTASRRIQRDLPVLPRAYRRADPRDGAWMRHSCWYRIHEETTRAWSRSASSQMPPSFRQR